MSYPARAEGLVNRIKIESTESVLLSRLDDDDDVSKFDISLSHKLNILCVYIRICMREYVCVCLCTISPA